MNFNNEKANLIVLSIIFLQWFGLFFALLSEWNIPRKFPGHMTESVRM